MQYLTPMAIPGPVSRHDEDEHRRAAHRAIGASALGLGVTGAVELTLALFTMSVGLLGDSLHNLSDVSTSLVVWVGFRISRRPPTERLPYGYERAEDLAGLGVALVIWASAVFAGVESYRKLVGHGGTAHLGWGMVGAVLGVVGNQLVARYKLTVGRRIQSATLIADARHSWLDAISSVGAFLGLLGVAAGYRWADPVAGFAVTMFIVHVGYEVTIELLHHLMDGVDADVLAEAKQASLSVPGVQAAMVRGRWTGRTLRLEVDGYLDNATTVSRAEEIGATVGARVFEAVPEARQVRFNARPATPTTARSADVPEAE